MPWEYMSLIVSSGGIVRSLWAEWPRNWFDYWQEEGIFLFSNHADQLRVRSHPRTYIVLGGEVAMKLTTYLHLLHGSIHPLPLMPLWCGMSNAFVFHFLDCMENFSMVVPPQFFSSVWVWANSMLIILGSSGLLHPAVYICSNISEELAACIFRLAWI